MTFLQSLFCAIQNPNQLESKPLKANSRALYCDIKGWECKLESSAEFKPSVLVILLQILEPSRRGLTEHEVACFEEIMWDCLSNLPLMHCESGPMQAPTTWGWGWGCVCWAQVQSSSVSTHSQLISSSINSVSCFFQFSCLFQVKKSTLSSDSSRKMAFWLFMVQIMWTMMRKLG